MVGSTGISHQPVIQGIVRGHLCVALGETRSVMRSLNAGWSASRMVSRTASRIRSRSIVNGSLPIRKPQGIQVVTTRPQGDFLGPTL